jgi:hypothetical protein
MLDANNEDENGDPQQERSTKMYAHYPRQSQKSAVVLAVVL